ncbi:rhodanese-like domain-containing protein [Brevibacillus borstelensis]|uniref:rhodanese-like domain-containing protein n=1 Tax=Brevibacillus borstelensis TaxID=45462 RepID=UPI0030BC0F58
MEQNIQVRDLLDRIAKKEKLFLLDVRDEDKYLTGSLDEYGVQTKNLPYLKMIDPDDAVIEKMESLPKDRPIITLCTSGNKARKAAELLREKGCDAIPLEGGLTAWKQHHEA